MSDGRKVKQAYNNPWYALMTLYGEQTGEDVDEELHAKNRAAWNAWSCQAMTEDERVRAADLLGVTLAELSAWADIKAEVERQFLAKVTAQWIANYDLSSMYASSKLIDFSGVTFFRPLVLKSMMFGRPVLFNKVSFKSWFDAERSVFKYGVGVNYSQFEGDAWLAQSAFQSGAKFNGTTFHKSVWLSHAILQGGVSFGDSVFSGEAWFGNARFRGPLSFSGAKFNRLAYFGSAKFEEIAKFDGSRFEGDARFDGAEFDEGVWFQNSQFIGMAHFDEAIFGKASESTKTNFSNCHFARPTSFQAANFKAEYPDFSGTVLHDKTTFTAKPEFWPQGSQSDPEQAKASCAVIRHNLGRQGLPEEEHFFFRREMGFAAQIGGWWQRLPYRAFGAVSDFGYSIQRPALWMLGLFIGVAMINHVVLQWGATLRGAEYHPAQAFALSFANQFPLFGLHGRWFSLAYLQDLNPWLKALGGLQTVASLPLLFFLGLGLRTRFRMR